MGLSDKQNARRKPRASGLDSAAAETPARPATTSFRAFNSGVSSAPRVWILPAAHGEFLAVATSADVRTLADELRAAPPELLVASAETATGNADKARAWKTIEPRLVEQIHEAIFDFAKRMMVSVGWLAAAFALTRIEGEFEDAGFILGVLGLGFLAYTILRYGYRIVRWHNRRVDASQAFAQASVRSNPLAQRLARALELRTKLRPEDRGSSPDDELLDSNAYRKLIADGTTTTAEFIALGEAVNAALKFQDEAGLARKISDVAKDAGIGAETAIFYRDLAAAASEIGLTGEISKPD